MTGANGVVKGDSTSIAAATMRRFILGKQGLWPGRRWQGKSGAAQAIRSIGGVQIDPLVVVARNHDLKLHSRVDSYDPDHLNDLLYQERQFFDYGGLLYIYPMDELPYWKVHMQRQWWGHELLAKHPGVLDTVRAELRARGPLAQRDLEGTARVESYRARKDTGLALAYLWRIGELMTAGRRGFDRLYDFAENVAPAAYLNPAGEAEAETFFLRKALLMDAMPRLTEWRGRFAYFVQRQVMADEMKRRIAELVESGDVAPLTVEGKKDLHYVFASELPRIETLEAGQVPDGWQPLDTTTETEVNFLAPLDPVSAGGRAGKLFNFEYTWEIYTPIEKRRWGYYVLPILYGDRLVARMDVKLDRKSQTLLIKGFWLEDPATGKDATFAAALARGLIRFTRFHNATRLDARAIQPASLRAARLFQGSGVTLV
ncbi:MAG: YcaQ family DNA glycosylase [Anaerolineae bacterium]|nr:YcaQ family DNA glycosylase [Anaerolineae bacterium]